MDRYGLGIGRSDRVQEEEMPSESVRGMCSTLRTKGNNTHYVLLYAEVKGQWKGKGGSKICVGVPLGCIEI